MDIPHSVTSAEVGSTVQFEDMFVKLLYQGQAKYLDQAGSWKTVGLSSQFDLEINELDSHSGYAIYLKHKSSSKFVGMLILDKIVKRRADKSNYPNTYSPTSYLLKPYRGLALMTSMYTWVLNNRFDLQSNSTQSADSNVLWTRLSKRFKTICFPTDPVARSLETWETVQDLSRLSKPKFFSVMFSAARDQAFQKSFVESFVNRVKVLDKQKAIAKEDVLTTLRSVVHNMGPTYFGLEPGNQPDTHVPYFRRLNTTQRSSKKKKKGTRKIKLGIINNTPHNQPPLPSPPEVSNMNQETWFPGR